jgi:hypothetical protein
MQQMQKRLGIGFLKGLVLGAAVGFGVHLGLRWPLPSGGLLAYLFAMGVGGTAGVFGGRAPWKEGAWLEALLKMIFGVGVGALLYWLASRYAPFELPMPGGALPWTSVAPLFLPLIGALYGAVIELDHDGLTENKKASSSTASKTSSSKVRVDTIDEAEVVDAAASRSKKAR